jgi:hypothetical protein
MKSPERILRAFSFKERLHFFFAFGETFVEEHSNTDRTPYLFNWKISGEEIHN